LEDYILKIIASDYDGTLRRHHGIEQKDRDAIKEWRADGNLFGIVTVRDQPFVKSVTDEDNLELDFLIIYNGALTYEFDGNQPNLIKRELGKTDRLYEIGPMNKRKSGDWAEFITPDKNYYLTYGDEPVSSRDNWVRKEALKDVHEFIQIYSLCKTEEEALEVARCLNDSFSDAVSPLVNGAWLNVAPPGVTKASGVWEYAKLKSVSKENIFTIGDSYNDLAMIKEFNGYTLENGAEELKKTARAVYAGVWELIYNAARQDNN
jgi:HAD superfamily hydrolase (TIGR01484 family)